MEMQPTAQDLEFMRLAIEEAKKSLGEEGRSRAEIPYVGVVIVKDGVVLGTGFRGATGPKDHAEFGLLEKRLKGESAVGATAYVTLEPCTTRSPEKTPCAEWLIEHGIGRVWIGCLDPDPRIRGSGQRHFDKHNVPNALFPQHLRKELEVLNREFTRLKLDRAEAAKAVVAEAHASARRYRRLFVFALGLAVGMYFAIRGWLPSWLGREQECGTCEAPLATLASVQPSASPLRKAKIRMTEVDRACGLVNLDTQPMKVEINEHVHVIDVTAGEHRNGGVRSVTPEFGVLPGKSVIYDRVNKNDIEATCQEKDCPEGHTCVILTECLARYGREGTDDDDADVSYGVLNLAGCRVLPLEYFYRETKFTDGGFVVTIWTNDDVGRAWQIFKAYRPQDVARGEFWNRLHEMKHRGPE